MRLLVALVILIVAGAGLVALRRRKPQGESDSYPMW